MDKPLVLMCSCEDFMGCEHPYPMLWLNHCYWCGFPIRDGEAHGVFEASDIPGSVAVTCAVKVRTVRPTLAGRLTDQGFIPVSGG
jgi:hypothetical protein